jgi:F-type H+-transporting ATPase subunit alpha
MSNIRPDEISSILKDQITGFNTAASLEEVGTVLQVGDGIARIYGLLGVQYGELVEFTNGVRAVALNLEQDNVGAVLMGSSGDITEGDKVKRTGKIASINAGHGVLGRVINALGQPVDGKGPITGELFEMPLERKAPGVLYREPVTEPLQTGIKAIDAMIPIWRSSFSCLLATWQSKGVRATTPLSQVNDTEFEASKTTTSTLITNLQGALHVKPAI